MSAKILIEDQIEKLYSQNPDLESCEQDKFEVSIANFLNISHFHSLNFDDLLSGFVGSGGDEGIDLCYCFCNGRLVFNSLEELNEDSKVTIKLFQVKHVESFSTNEFMKFKEGVEQIFNFDIKPEDLLQRGANTRYVEKLSIIRKLYRESSLVDAKFECQLYYVTSATDKNISPKIDGAVNDVLEKFHFISACTFLNGRDILDIIRGNKEKIEIKFSSQPIKISERDVETSGYSGYINGNDLINSLRDEKNQLKSHLTEGNVRFFLGENININESIISSAIDSKQSEIFWAMNNGMTIISESISELGGNEFAVKNPKIVNGCQTLHCLDKAHRKKQGLPERLKIFVKLVQANSLDIQNQIISATNSQNAIKSSSLKANDDVQRNIEEYLEKYGFFYERRENFHKYQGKVGPSVISMMRMAQIVHTIVNKESIVALNDTAKLFEEDSKYLKIFPTKTNLDIYVYAVKLYNKVCLWRNRDVRAEEGLPKEQLLLTGGTYTIMSCMSSVVLQKAQKKVNPNKNESFWIHDFDIKSNRFKKNFDQIYPEVESIIESDIESRKCFDLAKKIYITAVDNYAKKEKRSYFSVFKRRTFDKNYMEPVIIEALLERKLTNLSVTGVGDQQIYLDL